MKQGRSLALQGLNASKSAKEGREVHLETDDLEWLASRLAELLHEKIDNHDDIWINEEAAMRIMNISSKTTMLRLRNEGAIRFSQIYKKIIVYDKNSILNFLEKHAKNTF